MVTKDKTRIEDNNADTTQNNAPKTHLGHDFGENMEGESVRAGGR